jgi:hypothetical protein
MSKRSPKGDFKMKKVTDLINAIEELGFGRDYAWTGVDACLDDINPNRPNEDTENEEINDELYNDILIGFKAEKAEKEYAGECDRREAEAAYQTTKEICEKDVANWSYNLNEQMPSLNSATDNV